MLDVLGDAAFVSIEQAVAGRLSADDLLDDSGPFVGRARELGDLRAALETRSLAPAILVCGRGGSAKTRLLLETLSGTQLRDPRVPVVVLAAGRSIDGDALTELPQIPIVVVIDDVHRDPSAVRSLRAHLKASRSTLILRLRPYGLNPLRSELLALGAAPSSISTVEIRALTSAESLRLVRSLCDGFELSFPVRAQLGAQAADSPHIAVIAAGLIRRGELGSDHLSLSTSLRQTVLAK